MRHGGFINRWSGGPRSGLEGATSSKAKVSVEASSEVVEGFVTGVLVTTGEAMGESASEGMAEGADWQGGFSIAT